MMGKYYGDPQRPVFILHEALMHKMSKKTRLGLSVLL